jgi:hypothetical protein
MNTTIDVSNELERRLAALQPRQPTPAEIELHKMESGNDFEEGYRTCLAEVRRVLGLPEEP